MVNLVKKLCRYFNKRREEEEEEIAELEDAFRMIRSYYQKEQPRSSDDNSKRSHRGRT